MKASIPRTATLSWSPATLEGSEPLIATGAVSGALDASFSNEAILEIWKPSYAAQAGADPKPIGTATTASRFNRLAWGHINPSRPQGLIAAGLESGELAIWDADKVIKGDSDSQVITNNQHTGPIKGLHFNPIQNNLLASGGVNGEVYIWDLANPTKPYSPGARSQKLDEITSLSWNSQVAHILATSSSSGYTVVWDLKNKREVTALAYGGGAGTSGGGLSSTMNGNQLAAGARRGMGAVCWHPDTPTRLATASDDDSSPVIMLWDLRNARAPEKILTGHEKGVLALSWCKQDADLLLSCGKDNRTICWNPQSSEIVGELPPSNNWSFDVQWCPRNPDLLATASFDGVIGIHSLQATNAPEPAAQPSVPAAADGSDIFNLPSTSESTSRGLSLQQPPKWLRKPVAANFGFGGQLVSVSNLPSKTGGAQSSVVHLRDVVTEPTIVSRATRLQQAIEGQGLAEFCEERSKDPATRPDDVANWKALGTLFHVEGSREQLVQLLGFSKADVADKVSNAIAAFKRNTPGAALVELPPVQNPAEAAAEEKPADVAAAIEPVADAEKAADAETEGALFGETAASTDAGADIFSTIGNETAAAEEASTDAAPAARSRGTFKIYPTGESEADKLITRALVLGDFESAVSLCVSADRFADALLLAVQGGPELLARTQKAYFDRRSATLPYLRLLQSIVSDDLSDVVQNADLSEWQEIFVVLCTFAKSQEEFALLAEQLGQRLGAEYAAVRGKDAAQAKAFRKDAVMCFLAAGNLERVSGMWIDEMQEEESALRSGSGATADADGSLYGARAEALQTFMEKVTVFQSAVNYVDADLAAGAPQSGSSYRLASLYDRIHEYVDVLADQGLVGPALKYISQTPGDYGAGVDAGSVAGPSSAARQRLQAVGAGKAGSSSTSAHIRSAPIANGASVTGAASSSAYAPAAPNVYAPSTPAVASAYDPYGSLSQQQQQQPQAANDPYAAAYNPYGAPAAASQPAPVPQASYGGFVPQPQQPLAAQTTSAYAPAAPMVPAPPPPITGPIGGAASSLATPPPLPPKRDNSGWNDVPTDLVAPRRTGSAIGQKAAPIVSPFPNSPAPQPGMYGQPPIPGMGMPGQQGGPGMPPPPRGPSRGPISPPPQGPPQSSQYGRPQAPMGFPGQQQQQQARPPPPQGPPRAGSAAGMRPPPPSGPYAPAPGQVSAPPPPAPFGGPGPQQGPGGPGFGGPQQQQQQQFQQGPPQHPGQPPQGPPTGFARPPPGVPGMMQPPPPGVARAATPGAGAGAPPRSQTPAAKPASKYPPGDRTHIPDAHKPIFNTLSRELAKMKAQSPPAQKRMVDDAERRLNILFDHLNCGTVDAKIIPGLVNLCQAIDARNQQAALQLQLQVAQQTSGDLVQALTGVRMILTSRTFLA